MKKTFLTLIAALMVCVAFAQDHEVKSTVQKSSEKVKETIQLGVIVDRNTGCALLRASDFPYSSLDVYILVRDVNSKTYRQHHQLPVGLNELLITPKYGDIDLVDIISITPDEDAYYYYRQ